MKNRVKCIKTKIKCIKIRANFTQIYSKIHLKWTTFRVQTQFFWHQSSSSWLASHKRGRSWHTPFRPRFALLQSFFDEEKLFTAAMTSGLCWPQHSSGMAKKTTVATLRALSRLDNVAGDWYPLTKTSFGPEAFFCAT